MLVINLRKEIGLVPNQLKAAKVKAILLKWFVIFAVMLLLIEMLN